MLWICKKEEQGTNVDVSIAITKKKERQSDHLDVLHTFFDKKSRSEDFQKKNVRIQSTYYPESRILAINVDVLRTFLHA